MHFAALCQVTETGFNTCWGVIFFIVKRKLNYFALPYCIELNFNVLHENSHFIVLYHYKELN